MLKFKDDDPEQEPIGDWNFISCFDHTGVSFPHDMKMSVAFLDGHSERQSEAESRDDDMKTHWKCGQ